MANKPENMTKVRFKNGILRHDFLMLYHCAYSKLKHCKNIVIEGRCHLFFRKPVKHSTWQRGFALLLPMTIIIAMCRHKMPRGVGLVSHFFASEAFYYIFDLFNEKTLFTCKTMFFNFEATILFLFLQTIRTR